MSVTPRSRPMADNQAGRARISNTDQADEYRPFRKSYALPYLAEQRTWSIGMNRKAERRGDASSSKGSRPVTANGFRKNANEMTTKMLGFN